MNIQLYKGKIIETNTEIIGYLIKIRKHLGNGCYHQTEPNYLIIVNEFTMPNNIIRGQFIVDSHSIEKYND